MEVSYSDIELYIEWNTLLKVSQILGNVVKPLIDSKKLIKLGRVKMANNYKSDFYKFAD
jgi:hypothetical protein